MTTNAESGFVEFDGARIYWEASGQGDPVLLIHAGVANLRMWDEQVEVFDDRYRIVRYDTRGYGRTETEEVGFSNRDDAAAVLTAAGVREPAHVLGLSRGGQIALDFALEYSDRVRSLTNVAGGFGGFEPTGIEPAADWAEVEAWWKAKDWDRLTEFETAFWVAGPGQPLERVDAGILEQVGEWIGSNYRAEKAEGQPRPLDPSAVQRIGDLTAPLLVILGTFDEPGTSAAMRHLAAVVPGAELVELPTAHMVNLELPEQFNQIVGDFWSRN